LDLTLRLRSKKLKEKKINRRKEEELTSAGCNGAAAALADGVGGAPGGKRQRRGADGARRDAARAVELEARQAVD
jgi:hypothetical protein